VLSRNYFLLENKVNDFEKLQKSKFEDKQLYSFIERAIDDGIVTIQQLKEILAKNLKSDTLKLIIN
jgi:hypothetical protein